MRVQINNGSARLFGGRHGILNVLNLPTDILIIQVQRDDDFLGAAIAGEMVDLTFLLTHEDSQGVRLLTRLALYGMSNDHLTVLVLLSQKVAVRFHVESVL